MTIFRPFFTLVLVAPLLLTGCGGETAGDPQLDPLQLIENVETEVTRHHPTRYCEINVGEFYLTLPIEGSIDLYRISFELAIVVTKKEKDSVEDLLDEHDATIRDHVISTAQSIQEDKLHDPDMIWLKTELVSVLREELRTTAIRDVVFPMLTIERG